MKRRKATESQPRPTKPPPVLLSDRRRIHLHLTHELLDWIDRQAKRQRRSRAYVIEQSCELLKVVLDKLQADKAA